MPWPPKPPSQTGAETFADALRAEALLRAAVVLAPCGETDVAVGDRIAVEIAVVADVVPDDRGAVHLGPQL